MSTDLFGRMDTNLKGVFIAEHAKLGFGGSGSGDTLGTLAQSLQFSYSQAITRLYEINSPAQQAANMYYVVGRTQGQATLGRVIGPQQSVKDLYSQYGCACKAKSNTITLTLETSDCLATADCSADGTDSLTYTLGGCVMTMVGIALQAQDMLISEQSTMMFSSLDVSGGGGTL